MKKMFNFFRPDKERKQEPLHIPITPLQEQKQKPEPLQKPPSLPNLNHVSSRKMSSSLKKQVSMLNPTPLEHTSSRKISSSLKKRVASGQLDSLKYNIIKFITNGYSEIFPDIIQEKHKKSIETQIDIINAAIIATNNEEVNKLFHELKVNFRDNTVSPTIFIDYSKIFCNLQLSNICKAFIELQSIYTFYTYHNMYIRHITYQFAKPSKIFEDNLVQYINNPNIKNFSIINIFYTEIWEFLSNSLYNPSISTEKKRCLYFYDKTIINYVQSIIDVYNEFVRFISENKIENENETKISNNIFQISINKLDKIYVDTNINTIIINDETNKKAILEIIETIKIKILPEIKNAFNYLQDLYFPERVNARNFIKKHFNGGSRTVALFLYILL